jgi:site-specific DNA-cytosine methylase
MKIDHSAKHDELRQVQEEKAGPLTPELLKLGFTPTKHKAIRLVGFMMSPLFGGGRWLPRLLRTKKIGVAQIDVRAVGLAIRHDKILYRHPRFDEGFICERDAARFADIQKEVFATTVQLLRTYKRLKKSYRKKYPELVSTESWKKRFQV